MVNKMVIKVIYWFLVYCLCLNLSTALVLPRDKLTIVEQEGFLTYLMPDIIFGTLNSCQVTTPGSQQFTIDIKSAKSTKQTTITNEVIDRFSTEFCGVRVNKVSKSSKGLWTLSAKDQMGRQLSGSFTIDVMDKFVMYKELNITVSQDAESQRFTCPDADGNRYCRIYDKLGRVYQQCEKLFDFSLNNDHFVCKISKWGNMMELTNVMNFIARESQPEVVTSIVNNQEHIVMTCQIFNSERVSQCRAEAPGKGNQFLIMDGLLADSYSAFDTNTEKGRCSFELMKPLRKQDTGVWRILMDGNKNSEPKGCVFEVNKGTTEQINDDKPKVVEIYVEKVAELQIITCEVPYPIDYCYLQSPTSYNSTFALKEFGKMKNYGQCKFEVRDIVSGTWICGTNGLNGGEDVVKYYDYRVYYQPAHVLNQNVAVSRGDNVNLMCKSIFEFPMQYCRFTTPENKIHSIHSTSVGAFKDGVPHFSYYGAGLKAGECGITIHGTTQSDFGQWKCSFKIMNNEYTLEMNVEQRALTVASIVGLSIGLVFVIFGGVLYLGYRFNIRRRYIAARQTGSETSSTNSVSFANIQARQS